MKTVIALCLFSLSLSSFSATLQEATCKGVWASGTSEEGQSINVKVFVDENRYCDEDAVNKSYTAALLIESPEDGLGSEAELQIGKIQSDADGVTVMTVDYATFSYTVQGVPGKGEGILKIMDIEGPAIAKFECNFIEYHMDCK